MLLKHQNNLQKQLCSTFPFPAREKKGPTACFPASAWARGPAANQQAAEPACAPRPPGLKVAH
jgi:hypothetical protein